MKVTGEVVQGHKGVCAVEIPFDPEVAWKRKPHRLAGRRHGWPVVGKVNGKKFEGYVGDRWGHFFITVVGLEPGTKVTVQLEPTDDERVVVKAIEQSKETTQPKKPRSDALQPLIKAAPR